MGQLSVKCGPSHLSHVPFGYGPSCGASLLFAPALFVLPIPILDNSEEEEEEEEEGFGRADPTTR